VGVVIVEVGADDIMGSEQSGVKSSLLTDSCDWVTGCGAPVGVCNGGPFPVVLFWSGRELVFPEVCFGHSGIVYHGPEVLLWSGVLLLGPVVLLWSGVGLVRPEVFLWFG